jgi:alpha-tubulin suppressor-like RCC1 family protein
MWAALWSHGDELAVLRCPEECSVLSVSDSSVLCMGKAGGWIVSEGEVAPVVLRQVPLEDALKARLVRVALQSERMHCQTVESDEWLTAPLPAGTVSASWMNGRLARVDADGDLYVWGESSSGALALGDSVSSTEGEWMLVKWGMIHCHAPWSEGLAPADSSEEWFRLPLPKLVSVSCGFNHTVVVDFHGWAWACGSNLRGECGFTDRTEPRSTLTRVDALGPRYPLEHTERDVMVSESAGSSRLQSIGASLKGCVSSACCGDGHTLFSTHDARALACGSNSQCQLGLPNRQPASSSSSEERVDCSFEPVVVLAEGVESVLAGSEHSVALTRDSLRGWGFGWSGKAAPKAARATEMGREVALFWFPLSEVATSADCRNVKELLPPGYAFDAAHRASVSVMEDITVFRVTKAPT